MLFPHPRRRRVTRHGTVRTVPTVPYRVCAWCMSTRSCMSHILPRAYTVHVRYIRDKDVPGTPASSLISFLTTPQNLRVYIICCTFYLRVCPRPPARLHRQPRRRRIYTFFCNNHMLPASVSCCPFVNGALRSLLTCITAFSHPAPRLPPRLPTRGVAYISQRRY